MSLDEVTVLNRLAQIKQALIALSVLPERDKCTQLSEQHAEQLRQLSVLHKERKQQRDRQRHHYRSTLTGESLAEALARLEKESQQDGMERRRIKQSREQVLAPIQAAMSQTERAASVAEA